MPTLTSDDIVEQGFHTLEKFVDGESLKAGLTLGATAQIFREIAAKCRSRADGLIDEEEQALKGED